MYLHTVGFDDQGVYYFDNSPNQNIQFVPFWGFGGSPATIMQEIQGGLQSITGTSPGKQPLPLSECALSCSSVFVILLTCMVII